MLPSFAEYLLFSEYYRAWKQYLNSKTNRGQEKQSYFVILPKLNIKGQLAFPAKRSSPPSSKLKIFGTAVLQKALHQWRPFTDIYICCSQAQETKHKYVKFCA